MDPDWKGPPNVVIEYFSKIYSGWEDFASTLGEKTRYPSWEGGLMFYLIVLTFGAIIIILTIQTSLNNIKI
jgi:hypothetical protein